MDAYGPHFPGERLRVLKEKEVRHYGVPDATVGVGGVGQDERIDWSTFMEKLRVFISGTQDDMKPERDAVDRAVNSTELATGLRAETAVSQLRSPRAWIEQNIRECSIYAGVYSHRYGWVIPGENISATEFEFNLARLLQKPILIWIRDVRDDEQNLTDFDKQTQFLKRVSDFSEGYLRQTFDSPSDLEKLVTVALREAFIEIIRRSTGSATSFLAEERASDQVELNSRETLFDKVRSEPNKSALGFIQLLSEEILLLPLGLPPKALLTKIELIDANGATALSELEAFVLVVANCLPHLLQQYQAHSGGGINRENLTQLVQELSANPSAPSELRTALMDVSNELILVANAIFDFDPDDPHYTDSRIRNERIRLRLLGSLIHLASAISLDCFVVPDLPLQLRQASWPSRFQWWRQAYVRSVIVANGKLQFFLTVPTGHKKEYVPILAEALDEQTQLLLQGINPILAVANMELQLKNAQVEEAEVSPIPKADWLLLVKQIEQEQAYRSRDRLQQDAFRLQRLRAVLVSAEAESADRMLAEGRQADAAPVFARISELLFRYREIYQAKRYAMRAAETYSLAGNKRLAGRQFLRAAEIWLSSALTPQLAQDGIEPAHRLANEMGEPAFLISTLIVAAHFNFGMLDDAKANECVQEAYRLLPSVADLAERLALNYDLIRTHFVLAMASEQWETAIQVVEAGFAALVELRADQRAELLRLLVVAYSERGQWQNIDRLMEDNKGLLDAMGSVEKGKLLVQYATSFARRGDLDEALNQFGQAQTELQAEGDQYTIAMAYQTKLNALFRGGVVLYPGLADDESRRIDLFNQTRGENIGYILEEDAIADLQREDYREAIQHLRLALWHYWREGAWAGIESAYRLLAKLHSAPAVNEFIEALKCATYAGDAKLAESLSQVVAQRSGLGKIGDIFDGLMVKRPTGPHRLAAMQALREFVDLVPKDRLAPMLDYLLSILADPDDKGREIPVRCCTVQVLRGLLPQLSGQQATSLLTFVQAQMQLQQHWTLSEEFLKLIEAALVLPDSNVAGPLLDRFVDLALNIPFANPLHMRGMRVAVYAAKISTEDTRRKVVNFLSSYPNQFDRLHYLAAMNEPVRRDELESAISVILQAANRQPVDVAGGVQIVIPAVRPAMLKTFVNLVPPELRDTIISGLLQAIINKHGNMGERSDAIWTLSELPPDWLAARADEIVDYLEWGAQGSLPRSAMVDIDLASQTDPFTNVRMNFGNIEGVRQSSLRALGSIYFQLDEAARGKVINQLVLGSRDKSPVVRQGVALGLTEMESDNTLDVRLLLTLFVLMNDADARPCSWACKAAGRLVSRNLTAPLTNDIVERLLELSTSEESVDLRVGAALGLKAIDRSDSLDENINERIRVVLVRLSQDASYRVRFNASS
jgi:tetratricopeptide (TPR) repeat protein